MHQFPESSDEEMGMLRKDINMDIGRGPSNYTILMATPVKTWGQGRNVNTEENIMELGRTNKKAQFPHS